jgi:CHAD domain-containing protein
MAGKSDPGVMSYCAAAMLPHIEVLQATAKKINKRKNIEDIHDIRVTSRRIRTCLTIFEEYFPPKKFKTWSKVIKGITNAYGVVRDLDVQIELLDRIYTKVNDPKIKSGLRRIRLRLKQQRGKRQAETTNVTQVVIESPTLAELKEWCEKNMNAAAEADQHTPALYQLGYKNIQHHLDEFLFFEVFIFDPARVKELHQMRIAAKRLRYSLEVFSQLYKYKSDFALDIARQSQEYLGQIHDSDVWISFLPEFMEREQNKIQGFYGYGSPFSRLKPGIEYLIKNRQEERRKLYKKFLQEWQKWKMKETWLNLRKVIFLTSFEEIESAPILSDEQAEDSSKEINNNLHNQETKQS